MAPRPCRHHGGGIWPALASWDQSRPIQGSSREGGRRSGPTQNPRPWPFPLPGSRLSSQQSIDDRQIPVAGYHGWDSRLCVAHARESPVIASAPIFPTAAPNYALAYIPWPLMHPRMLRPGGTRMDAGEPFERRGEPDDPETQQRKDQVKLSSTGQLGGWQQRARWYYFTPN